MNVTLVFSSGNGNLISDRRRRRRRLDRPGPADRHQRHDHPLRHRRADVLRRRRHRGRDDDLHRHARERQPPPGGHELHPDHELHRRRHAPGRDQRPRQHRLRRRAERHRLGDHQRQRVRHLHDHHAGRGTPVSQLHRRHVHGARRAPTSLVRRCVPVHLSPDDRRRPADGARGHGRKHPHRLQGRDHVPRRHRHQRDACNVDTMPSGSQARTTAGGSGPATRDAPPRHRTGSG